MPGRQLTGQQVDFVRKYLLPGFGPAAAAASTAVEMAATATADPTGTQAADRIRDQAKRAREIWIEAKDSVDVQISGLQRILREIDDPNCQLIADRGLAGFTGGLQTELIAALMSVEKGPDDRVVDLRSDAIDAIEGYQGLVAREEKIAAIEDLAALPEIGAPVRIRAELSGALSAMHGVLAA